MGGSPPKPPDYGPIYESQVELGEEQLQFQREVQDWVEVQNEQYSSITNQVVDYMFDTADEERQFADYQRDQYLRFYEPIAQQSMLDDYQRTETAYQQKQEQYDRAVAEQERLREAGIEDRDYYINTVRPLQEELIEAERQRQEREDATRQDVIGTALEEQKRLQGLSQEDRARYEEEFLPYESQFAEELRNYDTPERREQEASMAMSEVGQAYDAERKNAERRLLSYGVDPSMLRAGAIDLESRMSEAAAQAGAGTGARIGVEQRGLQAKQAAIGIGQSVADRAAQSSQLSAGSGALATGAISGADPSADTLAGQAAGSATGNSNLFGAAGQLASQSQYSQVYNPFTAGQAALASGNQSTSAASSALGTAQSGFGSYVGTGANALGAGASYGAAASGSYQGAANTLNAGYQNELAAWEAGQANSPLSFLSSGAGLLGGIFAGGFAEGGVIPDVDHDARGGGAVPDEASPSGGANEDDVLAAVEAGEFVIPEDVVRWEGEKTIHKMIERARKERGVLPTS